MAGLFLQLTIFLFLILIGLVVGRMTEKQHFQSLQQRELEYQDVLITQLKSFPIAKPGEQPPQLFIGEVVIASDYLKSFFAKLRGIFGGEVKSYQSLLIRARREATLRILEQAQAQNYNAICNLRLETADVGGNTSSTNRGVVMVAILASATAYHRQSMNS